MDDRLQRVEAKIEKSGADVRRLTLILSLFMLTLIALVVAAAMATDIFKVEYNGTTRFQVDDKGTATINTDTSAADVALKILSAPNGRGDIRFYTRSSDPTNPQVGDLWYNSAEQKFKLFDGFKRAITFDGLTQVVDDANTTNNNDGTRGANSSVASDDPTWTTDAKLGGSALSFDGTDDYALRGSMSASLSGNFTVEAWIKSSYAHPYQARMFDLAEAGSNGLQLCMTSAGAIGNENDGGPSSSVWSSNGKNDNTWHHVLAVRSGTTYTIYVDGNSLGSVGGTAPTYTKIVIGASSVGPTAYFKGSLDEVAIWNVALTPAQISARYNGGAGAELVGNESGLVSVWHLNDPK